MSTPAPSLVAPVCSAEEARRAIAAGAAELYCGVLTGEWLQRYGDGETISRRQGRLAHVAGMDELAQIARLSAAARCTVALTLNSRQASAGDPAVVRLAGLWEEMGGTAVMVADIGLLLALRQRKSKLRPHLSVLTGVFNSRNVWVAFYFGGEEYCQTVHREGDGDAALLGWIKAGGTLVTLGSGPFPFYYNEKDKPVVSAPKFGLPISGINLSYSDSGVAGPADGDILVSLRKGHRPTADYIRTLRLSLNRDFPGVTITKRSAIPVQHRRQRAGLRQRRSHHFQVIVGECVLANRHLPKSHPRRI